MECICDRSTTSIIDEQDKSTGQTIINEDNSLPPEPVRAISYVLQPYVNPCFVQASTTTTKTSSTSNPGESPCEDPGVEVSLLTEFITNLGYPIQFMEAHNLTEAENAVDRGFDRILRYVPQHLVRTQRMTQLAKTGWFLMLAITLGVYANFLAISLSKRSPPPKLFTGLREYARLLETHACKAVLDQKTYEEGGSIHDVVNPNGPKIASAVTDPDIRRSLLRAFRSNPPRFTNSDEEIGQLISDPDACNVGIIYKSQDLIMNAKFCSLETIDLPTHEIGHQNFGFLYRRSAGFAPHLSMYLSRGSAFDYYRMNMEKYVRSVQAKANKNQTKTALCSALYDVDDRNYNNMTISHLADLLWVSVGFLSTSLLLLLLEKALHDHLETLKKRRSWYAAMAISRMRKFSIRSVNPTTVATAAAGKQEEQGPNGTDKKGILAELSTIDLRSSTPQPLPDIVQGTTNEQWLKAKPF